MTDNLTDGYMKKKISPEHIIQHDTRIGRTAAENDDEFLLTCFVDNKALAEALSTNTPGMILAGRTGSGKTAILRYIEHHHKVARIEPARMALQYISNSDILRFLHDIGADLDILFQTIWKHVLCVEYIRLRYDINTEEKSKTWYQNLWGIFNNDVREKKALEYLDEWGGRFWVTIDENVKEVISKTEARLNAEIGVDFQKFKTKAGYGKNLSNEQKSEFIARVRKVIHADQLSDLSKVLDLLKKEEIKNKQQQPCYLLIDDLDERWIDDSLKYRMINALVETLKSFGKIQHLKILVALRSDVIERAMQESTSTGFQREKFSDYVIRIRWTEKELKEVVNRRIRLLYSRKYTKKDVSFEDIFPNIVKGEKPIKFLLDRTLLRPRDIIAFVNYCLEEAEDRVDVSSSQMLAAERHYSAERLSALCDEWRTAFPTLREILGIFSGGTSSRRFDEFLETGLLQEIGLQICGKTKTAFDPLFEPANKLFPQSGEPSERDCANFSRSIFVTLYRVGAIGIKSSETPYEYHFRKGRLISEKEIGSNSKFNVVKMLHRGLNINEKGRGKRFK